MCVDCGAAFCLAGSSFIHWICPSATPIVLWGRHSVGSSTAKRNEVGWLEYDLFCAASDLLLSKYHTLLLQPTTTNAIGENISLNSFFSQIKLPRFPSSTDTPHLCTTTPTAISFRMWPCNHGVGPWNTAGRLSWPCPTAPGATTRRSWSFNLGIGRSASRAPPSSTPRKPARSTSQS